MRIKKTVIISVFAVLTCLMLAGCGEEGSNVTIVNKTDQAITAVSFKESKDADFGKSLLEEDEKIAVDKDNRFKYSDSKEIKEKYDIQLTFKNKTVAVLHNVNIKDVDKASVYTENGVTYIKYKSKDSGKTKSTKAEETKIKAAAAKKAAEEAAAKKAAAEKAAAEKAAAAAAAQRAQQSQSSGSSGSGSSGSGSGGSGSGSGSGSSGGNSSNSGGCVGGNDLY